MSHELNHFHGVRLLILFVGLLGSSAVGADGARLHAQLAAGESWTMNLDGRQGSLRLSGGTHNLRPGGNHLTVRDVTWQGQEGVLKVLSDGQGQKNELKMKLNAGSHRRKALTCSGFLADAKFPIMAGGCETDAGTVPWFATRTSQGETCSDTSAYKEKYDSCVRDKKTLDGRVADRERQAQTARRQLAVCRSQLAQGAGGQGSSLKSFDRIKDKIDKPLTGSAGGAADGVITLDLPSAPRSSSRESMWLEAVGSKLLTAIHLGLRDDTARYQQAERSCGNIYCRLGLRANAILLMLGGTP